MVGLSGIEPLTSRLSGARSNHLSYRPPFTFRIRLPWRLSHGREMGHGIQERGSRTPWAPARERSPEKQNSARVGGTTRVDLETLTSVRVAGRWLAASMDRLAPSSGSPRKEVIQPHLPVRLPCYDLAPITGLTLGGCLLAVGTPTSGTTNFRGLTGGVYKARERIHRCLLISDY